MPLSRGRPRRRRPAHGAVPGQQRCGAIRLGQTRLTDVDLRGTAALTVTGDVQSLRGATIDTGQLMDLAPTLAAGLGLIVID